MKTNNYKNIYNTINAILHQETPNHLMPCTRRVKLTKKQEILKPNLSPKRYHINNGLTNLLTGAPTAELEHTPNNYPPVDNVYCAKNYNKGLTTKNNHVDVVNHIDNDYEKGLYILAIEYVYQSIKKMVKNGIKSNDDAYTDLFKLKNRYFYNGYDSNNYINDLISLTYIDILETIPQDAETHNFIETIASNVMQAKPTTNYKLHMSFCKTYYNAKSNPLIDYQNSIVNRIRTYYRNKGDLVERCDPKTVNTVAISHACDNLAKQRSAELIQQRELINKINKVVKQCTKNQRLVFNLKIKGFSYKEIAKKVGSTVSSVTNMYNKVIGRIKASINLKNYTCDTNYSDAYIIGIQLIEDVID